MINLKKTTISFGLVSIPIEMRPIIKNNDISFNQLHKKCLSRIKYVKYCPHCKKEVKQPDIIRGYEYQKDDYVTISNEEFNNLKSEDEKTIEIIGFIDLKEVDPIYFEKSYNISVEAKSKSFSLFKAALAQTKKELDLAISLINSLKMKFKPEELKDEYHDKVKEALDEKMAGKKIVKSKNKAPKNIKDLMTALELSLKNV